MQLVTAGKRAGRYFSAGRNRLQLYRQLKLPVATSVIGVPGGTIIVQKTQNIERIIINVANPYVVYDLLLQEEGSESQIYQTHEGGILGEGFEYSGYNPASAVIDDTQFSAFNKWVGANQHILTFVATSQDTYGPIYLAKVNTETMQTSYMFGVLSYTASTIIDQTDVDIVVAGHIGEGTVDNLYVVFSMTQFREKAGSPGQYERVFPVVLAGRIDRNDLDLTDECYPIWPLITSNGGHLDKLPAARSLCSAGKDKVAWFQAFDNPDLEEPHDPNIVEMPAVMVFDILTATLTRYELYQLTPDIPKYSGPVGDTYPTLYFKKAYVGYCGNGVLIAALTWGDTNSADDPYHVARSTDYGVTWQLTGHRIPTSQSYLQGDLTGGEHAVVSYAPGKVWIYTIDPGPTQAEDKFYVHVSEDYGASWVQVEVPQNRKRTDGTWRIASESSLAAEYGRIMPIYGKLGVKDVYCTTRYSADGTLAFIDVYDRFAPDAQKIASLPIYGKQVVTDNYPRAAAAFGRGLPLLPGHPGELGDSNVA